MCFQHYIPVHQTHQEAEENAMRLQLKEWKKKQMKKETNEQTNKLKETKNKHADKQTNKNTWNQPKSPSSEQKFLFPAMASEPPAGHSTGVRLGGLPCKQLLAAPQWRGIITVWADVALGP